jgi:hypothetical protein
MCIFSERRGRHAECALEGEFRYFHQPTKQRRGASRMTHSRRMFALADLHAGCRQQDQSLEEHARWAASIHNLPKTFPGLMSFPVITVIEEVAEASLGSDVFLWGLDGDRHRFDTVAVSRRIAHGCGCLPGQ